MFNSRKKDDNTLKYIAGGVASLSVVSILMAISYLQKGYGYIVESNRLHYLNDLNVTTPDQKTIKYHHERHLGGGEVHYTRPQVAKSCFANNQVIFGRSNPGLFQFSDGISVNISSDPLVASLQCFNDTLDAKATPLNGTQKKLLQEKFQQALGDKSKDLTEDGKKQLAKLINGIEVIVRPGKSHTLEKRLSLGSGYVNIQKAFWHNPSVVTFFAGHNYTDKHIEQAANNIINELSTNLPKIASVQEANHRTRPGRFRGV